MRSLRGTAPASRLGYVGWALAAYVLIASASLSWTADTQATAYSVAAFTLPLGLLAALVGSVLAVIANSLLLKFVFRLTPSVPLLLVAAAIVAVCVVTILTGLLTNRGITDHPPLEVLRNET